MQFVLSFLYLQELLIDASTFIGRNLLAQVHRQLGVVGFRPGEYSHGANVPVTGEVEQPVNATAVRPLVEIHYLHLTVGEGHVGEEEFGLPTNIDKQGVARLVDSKTCIDPFFIARDSFTVLPGQTLGRRQRYDDRRPCHLRQVSQRGIDYDRFPRGSHYNLSRQGAAEWMIGADDDRTSQRMRTTNDNSPALAQGFAGAQRDKNHR